MGFALAHALEFPGKLRLDQRTYLSVQTIYYPGFTIGGIAEPLSTVATLALLLTAPRDPLRILVDSYSVAGNCGHADCVLVDNSAGK